jgi:hypothetical protein
VSLIEPYLRAPEKLQPSRLTPQTEAMDDNLDIAQINLTVHGQEGLRLRNAITTASIARTIQGASTLTLNVQDSDYAILNSQWVAGSGITLIADQGGPTKTGVSFTQPVDVEIDGLWFRLVALELPAGSRNLVMTFEDREVTVLRSSIAPQAVEPTRRAVLHLPGFQSNANVTVKGARATKTQLANLQAVLDAGEALKVPRALLVVAVMTVTQESKAQNLLPSPSGVGLFQQTPIYWPATGDPTKDATAFFHGAIKV